MRKRFVRRKRMQTLFGLVSLSSLVFKSRSASETNMENYKEILSRLKFIACVKEGEKINTGKMYVQQDCIATSISRTFINIDNRTNTKTFVQNTVNRSFEILELCHNSDKAIDKDLCRQFTRDLVSAKEGIRNLKKTYAMETKFVCDLDIILEEIDVKVSLYKVEMEEMEEKGSEKVEEGEKKSEE